MDRVIVFPPNFVGPLPAKYKPSTHINYESRLFDFTDDLPKFKGFPHEGKPCDSQGNDIKK